MTGRGGIADERDEQREGQQSSHARNHRHNRAMDQDPARVCAGDLEVTDRIDNRPAQVIAAVTVREDDDPGALDWVELTEGLEP